MRDTLCKTWKVLFQNQNLTYTHLVINVILPTQIIIFTDIRFRIISYLASMGAPLLSLRDGISWNQLQDHGKKSRGYLG